MAQRLRHRCRILYGLTFKELCSFHFENANFLSRGKALLTILKTFKRPVNLQIRLCE